MRTHNALEEANGRTQQLSRIQNSDQYCSRTASSIRHGLQQLHPIPYPWFQPDVLGSRCGIPRVQIDDSTICTMVIVQESDTAQVKKSPDHPWKKSSPRGRTAQQRTEENELGSTATGLSVRAGRNRCAWASCLSASLRFFLFYI